MSGLFFMKMSFQQKRNYSLRLLAVQTKYRVRIASEIAQQYTDKVRNVKFPSRLRGTIVEKWADYWKNLTFDYIEVYKDSVKTCKENPRKAVAYSCLAGFISYLAVTNPDEISYRDALTRNHHNLLMIGPPVQNPRAVEYIKTMERHYSEGTLQYFSLGLFSIIWRKNYNDNLALYKANCEFLKPRYLTFYERILDIGLIDTWLNLQRSMVDYDINPNEWIDSKSNQQDSSLSNKL